MIASNLASDNSLVKAENVFGCLLLLRKKKAYYTAVFLFFAFAFALFLLRSRGLSAAMPALQTSA